MASHIMPTYARLPVTFTKGEGAWLWDNQNQQYLDAVSGISVCNLGHAHPAVHAALCEQSGKLLHTSNLYGIEHQETLADLLCSLTGMENVFFANSGAEANEAAIKLARMYAHQRGISKPEIIVMEKAFHGRTLSTLSATGNAKVQYGFEPLVEGFIRVPYGDINAVKNVLSSHPNVVAILLEPIQGEGGINIPSSNYLAEIRTLCDQYEILMMLDEIQSGMGRTGKFLACQHAQVLPDVCTLAKALANGVPIGACLTRAKAATLFSAGNHGSTFGGNPLACSAALATLKTLIGSDLMTQVVIKGQAICEQLKTYLAEQTIVKEIRHCGLMIGIELNRPCGELVKMALAERLLINVTNDSVIRLLPPFVIDQEQIELLTTQLSVLIKNFSSQASQS